jgi:hypothetical protein
MFYRKFCAPFKFLRLFIFLLLVFSVGFLINNNLSVRQLSHVVSNLTQLITYTPVSGENSTSSTNNSISNVDKTIESSNLLTTTKNPDDSTQKCANFSLEFQSSNMTSNYLKLNKTRTLLYLVNCSIAARFYKFNQPSQHVIRRNRIKLEQAANQGA